MENSEHVSVDMEKLAKSFNEQLETLLPLSAECSIYRVPESKRGLHPSHYTPQIISIGPLHHGKKKLKAMEEHKKRYLKSFLQRTEVRMARFFEIIKESETELRNCYAETILLASDVFVTMVLVDAVFLIEFFLRYYKPDLKTNDDRIFGKSGLHRQIRNDLWRLENQLPLFILRDLFNLAKEKPRMGVLNEEISLKDMTISNFRIFIFPNIPVEENVLRTNFAQAKHFLDLLIISLHPPPPCPRTKLKDQKNIPCAKTLHLAGIKFKSTPTQNSLDINFNKKTLKIPFFPVFGATRSLYRNLLAFESMHGYEGYFNDYIIMMRFLVRTPDDAEILVQKEILGVSESKSIADIFGSLISDCTMNSDKFHYSGVVAKLQAHCRKPCKKLMATWHEEYFNTPWSYLKVLGAVIILLFTAAQAVCTFIHYSKTDFY